jgi:hypothetical protein
LACEHHGQKAEIKSGIVGEEDGIEIAQEINEPGQDVIDGGLSPYLGVRDAMAMTGIIKNGHAQLDQRLM